MKSSAGIPSPNLTRWVVCLAIALPSASPSLLESGWRCLSITSSNSSQRTAALKEPCSSDFLGSATAWSFLN